MNSHAPVAVPVEMPADDFAWSHDETPLKTPMEAYTQPMNAFWESNTEATAMPQFEEEVLKDTSEKNGASVESPIESYASVEEYTQPMNVYWEGHTDAKASPEFEKEVLKDTFEKNGASVESPIEPHAPSLSSRPRTAPDDFRPLYTFSDLDPYGFRHYASDSAAKGWETAERFLSGARSYTSSTQVWGTVGTFMSEVESMAATSFQDHASVTQVWGTVETLMAEVGSSASLKEAEYEACLPFIAIVAILLAMFLGRRRRNAGIASTTRNAPALVVDAAVRRRLSSSSSSLPGSSPGPCTTDPYMLLETPQMKAPCQPETAVDSQALNSMAHNIMSFASPSLGNGLQGSMAPRSLMSSTPMVIPLQSPQATPLQSPMATPLQSPMATPLQSPMVTPLQSPVASPLMSPVARMGGSGTSMMGGGVVMEAMAASSATGFPAVTVDDFVLVRMGQEVLPACVVHCTGSNVTVRPLQAYRGRNLRRNLKWRKNPAGAKANYLVTVDNIMSSAFHLIEGALPVHIDSMVTSELGAPEGAERMPLGEVPRPQIPRTVASPYDQMPPISKKASNGEFPFGREIMQLRNLGFGQESRLRDILSRTEGNVDQSVRELNARRRFKHPTAFTEIKQMGFSNDDVIKALLMKHHGNKENVVMELLG